MGLLYAAKKYIVPALGVRCTDFLIKNMTPENAAVILEQCTVFDEQEVVKRCKAMISEHTDRVIQSEGFLNIKQSTLKNILAMDNLSATEVQIFESCIRWAHRRIGPQHEAITGQMIREALGEAINQIRFTTMSCDEFRAIVLAELVLKKEEVVMCLKYFFNNRIPQELPFCPIERGSDTQYTKLTCTEPHFESAIIGFQMEFCLLNRSATTLKVVGLRNISAEDDFNIYAKPLWENLGKEPCFPKWEKMKKVDKDDYTMLERGYILPAGQGVRFKYCYEEFNTPRQVISNLTSTLYSKGAMAMQVYGGREIPMTEILVEKDDYRIKYM